ncbi:type VI secretion system-associated protein TagF [Holophaga foetida]|uniref:type VI secretion system-associated protein TagF n=1 Tax=Holophaga foetida TaxID=35839 RepID=UPI0002472A66|nr:type VI secretion system-associated protein TagF [Holophaga foetida]
MSPILLGSPATKLPPLIFGKLPNRPDFVRINATHPVVTEFDELVQFALQHFRVQEGWESRYDQASPLDFCYTTRDQKWVFLGTMQRSQDQSGRRYPLVAGIAMPAQTVGNDQHLVPIAYEVFFQGMREQLSSAIENSVEALACRQFLESQTDLWSSEASDLPLAEQIVKQFTDTHHPSILEPPPNQEGASFPIAQALLNIAFYRDFLRRFPSTILVIDLPLRGGPGEDALYASTWLNILSALAGPEGSRNISFFLSKGPHRTHLIASFGRMPGKAFLLALGGEPPEELRLNLTTEQPMWQSHKIYAETTYAMNRILSDPYLPISSLLAFLKDASRKIADANQ